MKGFISRQVDNDTYSKGLVMSYICVELLNIITMHELFLYLFYLCSIYGIDCHPDPDCKAVK